MVGQKSLKAHERYCRKLGPELDGTKSGKIYSKHIQRPNGSLRFVSDSFFGAEVGGGGYSIVRDTQDIVDTLPAFDVMLLYFNCSVIACNRSVISGLLFKGIAFCFVV